MIVEGSNGSVEIVGNTLVIRRKGAANILTQGLQGDKTIPLSSITAVQFRSAGSMMAGMIQFTLIGGREFRGGMLEATKDENAVLFDNTQEPHFRALRDFVRNSISSLQNTPTSAGATPSIVDELTKLADLRDRGVLTDEEFKSAKARTLKEQTTPQPSVVAPGTGSSTDFFSHLPPPTTPKKKEGQSGCLTAFYVCVGLFVFLAILGSITGNR